jgi:hypothetical protein
VRPLFTRQQRIIHGVLERVVLAARVGQAVQPVRSCKAENSWWNDVFDLQWWV